jgi:hypothetical protein
LERVVLVVQRPSEKEQARVFVLKEEEETKEEEGSDAIAFKLGNGVAWSQSRLDALAKVMKERSPGHLALDSSRFASNVSFVPMMEEIGRVLAPTKTWRADMNSLHLLGQGGSLELKPGVADSSNDVFGSLIVEIPIGEALQGGDFKVRSGETETETAPMDWTEESALDQFRWFAFDSQCSVRAQSLESCFLLFITITGGC